MPNLLLTNHCNRRCPYCFAQEKVGGTPEHESSDLSFENLITVCDFLEKSHCDRIQLLGGEPTLHNQFPLFLQYLLSRNFNITVFSNGIISEEKLDKISKIIAAEQAIKERLRFVINVNYTRGKEEDLKQRHALNLLGPLVSLSFNIFSKNPPFDFLIEHINQYKLAPHIRLGLAAPIIGKKNTYLKLEDYRDVMESISVFAQRCDEHDIALGFDCGFPLCLFDDEKLGKLYRYRVKMQFSCGIPMDIGTDLNVWSCFPLSSLANRKLTEFDGLRDIKLYFEEFFKNERSGGGIFEQCNTCKHKERDQCSGGCLALQMAANDYRGD